MARKTGAKRTSSSKKAAPATKAPVTKAPTTKRPAPAAPAAPARPRGSVLSVASECVPWVKTGGLADVVGALPSALAPTWRVRTLIPKYRGIDVAGAEAVWHDDHLFGGAGRVLAATVDGVELLLLDAPHLFDRDGGPYSDDGGDFVDNPERFGALSWVAAQIAMDGLRDGWRPDVVHAHDWQAALAPAYLHFAESTVPTVMTIHNIAFQGVTGADRLDSLRIPDREFNLHSVEYHGLISTLKAGIVHADVVTTVSPTYADELMRPEFGFGLQGVVASRAADLRGIVNGVDTTVWNPMSDAAITPFSAADPAPKAINRARLIDEFGLAEPAGPLIVMVTRLTHQKGIDLVVANIDGLVELGASLIVLGSGDATFEADLRAAAERHRDRVGVRIGYDEALSHRLIAGGDVIIIPSRFEPCGLTQLYGLRYGTIPLVASTGGLRDTVIDAAPVAVANGVATGVVFSPVDAMALAQALRRLTALFADQPTWQAIRANAMATDVSWAASAPKYAQIYESLVVR